MDAAADLPHGFSCPDLFAAEMTEAGGDWYLVSFGGAGHRFTVKEAGDDPSTGTAYNEKADRRSWEMLKSPLAESLK
jgi:dienelactone hydrolase